MNRSAKSVLKNMAIWVFLFINFSPLIIALSNSLRAPENMRSPFSLFTDIRMDSYIAAFTRMKYLPAFGNSIFYTGISVAAITLLTSMAAYPMARIRSRFSSILSTFFIAGLIVPGQLSLMPVYVVLKEFNVLGTRIAPILVFITGGIAFSTFLFTGFIRNSVPYELEEAAVIDGANMFYRFWRIVFPLLVPATVAVVITQGIWIWNDFFHPMLLIGATSKKPLPQVMFMFLGDRENPTKWNVLFAACYLCAVPLLIIFGFFQKYFLSGLTIGAVKG